MVILIMGNFRSWFLRRLRCHQVVEPIDGADHGVNKKKTAQPNKDSNGTVHHVNAQDYHEHFPRGRARIYRWWAE
jgi:hypothetical protein